MSTSTKKILGKKSIDAVVNHREVYMHMIQGHVQGDSGRFIALREAINNSFDAGATKIQIRIGKKEGVPTLTISDNGSGFSDKGVASAMGYAASANARDDVKTIGANGTGLKSFLGLGNIESTKLTLYSVHRQHPGCRKMTITFRYLMDMINKKTKAEDHVEDVAIPRNWFEDLESKDRTTGTTLELTGHSVKIIGTAKNIIKHLGEYLTPKACSHVEIFDEGDWHKVLPVAFKGKYYQFVYPMETLGMVMFNIYYGDSNAEGPTICASMNAIQPFFDLVKHLDTENKKQISKVWKVIGGHIYIEKGNTFRRHDGSFGNAFYESSACPDFLGLLQAVGQELELLNEQERNTQVLQKREMLVSKIIEASQTINPVQPGTGGSPDAYKKGRMEPSQDELCLVPTRLRLYPGQTKSIYLHNIGTKSIDLSGVEWSLTSAGLTVISTLGPQVTIKAGPQVSEVTLVAKLPNLEHKVLVNIDTMPVGPYISGPGGVKPGTEAFWHLLRYDKIVDWQISPSSSYIKLEQSTDTKGEIKLTVSDKSPEGSFKLTAYRKGTIEEVASKQILVTHQNGRTSPIISVNNQEYNLMVDVYCPDTVAQIDYLWTEGEELPTIVVNPLHPRVKNLGSHLALDHYLAAIATAALAYQLEKKIITVKQVAPLIEEFIGKLKEIITFK
jgi:hypothetical protein